MIENGKGNVENAITLYFKFIQKYINNIHIDDVYIVDV